MTIWHIIGNSIILAFAGVGMVTCLRLLERKRRRRPRATLPAPMAQHGHRPPPDDEGMLEPDDDTGPQPFPSRRAARVQFEQDDNE